MTIKSIQEITNKVRVVLDSAQLHQCVFCHQKADKVVCYHCLSVLEKFSADEQSPFIQRRGDIQKHIACIADHHILAVGPHQNMLMDLINRFKYGKMLSLAPILTLFLRSVIRAGYRQEDMPQTLIPVPIHPIKRIIRGFNQTEEICRFLSRGCQLITATDWIKRTVYFTPQAGKTGKQRRQIKSSPFEVVNPKGLRELSHIAIFDDVITTGTTLRHLISDIQKVNPELRIDLWSLSVSLPR